VLVLACYADIPGNGEVDLTTLPDTSVGATAGGMFDGGLGLLPGTGGTLGGNPDASINPPASCDGAALGTVQSRLRYAQAQVLAAETCSSEPQQRTCTGAGWSAWSGSFAAESCERAAFRSCGAVPHGASEQRQRYANELVSNFALCIAENQTRTCNDGAFGAWSGSAQSTRCSVTFLGTCNPLSSDACAAGAVCALRLPPVCVGTNGHTCSANSDCQSGVCIQGTCAPGPAAAGGACEEASDCAACSNGAGAAVCSAAKLCACGVGASCSANNQCTGTCVAQKCVAPNTGCDNDDDCNPTTSKCVKSGASSGACLLKDRQPCSANTQCEHTCRPTDESENYAQKECAPRAGLDTHCDDNTDCKEGLVCRPWEEQPAPLSLATHCQELGEPTELCDESVDCKGASSGSACVANVCRLPTGSDCSEGPECKSGMCTPSQADANASVCL
jgi:hypothetical protein